MDYMLGACTDWTEHQPHLGGALGAAICAQVLHLQWATRHDRVIELTDAGRDGFRSWLGPKSLVASVIEQMMPKEG